MTSSADCFLNWMGLVWLGAVPALMNPNIPGDIAAEYIREAARDRAHHRRRPHRTPGAGTTSASPCCDAADTGTGDPAQAPAPFRHHADDPIAITHSSGTTRMPTAVVHSHASLFHATRKIRLSGPRAQGTERILSALPAPHAAGIMTINHALSNRSELLFLSQQSDGGAVLDAIEQWQPTGVFGFAVTWSELARFDLSEHDMDSRRAVVQHRRLRARAAHPQPGQRRQPQHGDPAGVQRVKGSHVRRRARLDRDGALRVPHHPPP